MALQDNPDTPLNGHSQNRRACLKGANNESAAASFHPRVVMVKSAQDGVRTDGQNTSVSKQRYAGFSAGSAIRSHQFARHLGRTSPSLRAGL